MFHAVPSVLSKNKSLVSVFQQGWNSYVSPGEAVYTMRGDGERLLAKAKSKGQRKRGEIHNKEIFL